MPLWAPILLLGRDIQAAASASRAGRSLLVTWSRLGCGPASPTRGDRSLGIVMILLKDLVLAHLH
jgi:hypothetical protein